MKITLFAENSLSLDLDCITQNMTKLAPDLTVVKGRASFKIKGFFVISPDAYKQLSPAILRESEDSDYVALFTANPYDNNYFWEGVDNKAIISLSGWEHLTTVPLNNGVVFFLCAMIVQHLEIGFRHDENTGCINDLWMDKTDVDLGMKSGTVCSDCLYHFHKHGNSAHTTVFSQIQDVLNDISAASRANMDICDYWRMRTVEENFDVFLCHNSQDKDAVRNMNKRLQSKKIRTWFDEEQLPPGRPWQELLEEQIGQIKTAAVFVGQSGLGPWQDIEMRAFLNEFLRRRSPVIPVILADCNQVPQLPLFLKQFTWVDFRRSVPEPFGRLFWGITGRKT